MAGARPVVDYDQLPATQRKLLDYMFDFLIDMITNNSDMEWPPGLGPRPTIVERDRTRRFLVDLIKVGGLKLCCDGETFWWEARPSHAEPWKIVGEAN